MERLRKLKLSYQALGSYFRRGIFPSATDSLTGGRFSKSKVDQVANAADSFVGVRFDKCKPYLPLIHQNLAKSGSFSSSSCVQPTFSPKSAHPDPFPSGFKRFFSRGNTEEKEELGTSDWVFLVFLALIGGLLLALMKSSMKEVPYTHRYISPIFSDNDRIIGEKMLKKKKEIEFKGAILPATHPHSVKVCFILEKLLVALHRDLGLDDNPRVTYNGLEGKTAFNFRDKSGLRGMNWLVVVVDKPEKEAYALGCGIIVVSSGLLDHHSDVGIAAVLAHEVGHSVARHVTEFLGFACLSPKSGLVDNYQRVEKEANNIGSQLMASAGYDPLLYENSEINYSECEANGPISLEETYTTLVARLVYREMKAPLYCGGM